MAFIDRRYLAGKMLVVSDSHGHLDRGIEALVNRIRPDTLVHLGDFREHDGDDHNSDHDTLTRLLYDNKTLRFVHVSGGRDAYGPFDVYLTQRNKHAPTKSVSAFFEAPYTLVHDITREDGRLNDAVTRGIKQGGIIVLHGHTHRQTLSIMDPALKDHRRLRFEHDHALPIPDGIVLINPGAYFNGTYCVIDSDDRTARFCKQTLAAQK